MYKVYEDKDIIVMNKDYGENSQDINEYYVVHRLDQRTCGLIVYAKNKQSASHLSKQIQNHTFQKYYYAIIEGIPKDHDTLINYLYRDRKKQKMYVVKRERKGVKKAILEYECINTYHNYSLIKIHLKTGRFHQIRAQFSHLGMPIIGDGKYGSKTNSQLGLCSYHIELIHPTTNKYMTFTIQPPNIKPWTLFEGDYYD